MKVASIHLAPGSHLPMRSIDTVEAEAGKGLVGDRYHGSRHRQVTIQSREALDRTADQLGYEFDAGATRRNITVDTGDIPTKPGSRLRIGEVEFEVVRVAAPCRLMEDAVGPGATAALRGRAGSACRVLSSGTIRVGDPVELLDD
ncbi:MAG TPA: MOSC domain-containing protein [Mycobacterium sp.]|uniref:MOSC domain-containing protein n=1 Tax=Mycolicibacterium sp. TaxID=2320850 RepID=UPI0025F3D864|nr:MOSC domain-containing protein [Mycolicibacterium sp.]HQC78484.1 MOSC domain-containing protein [Mycobacterium sp.]